MGNIGGLVLVGVLALTGCASSDPAMESVAAVKPAAVQSEMISALRPLLRTLKVSNAALIAEAYGACMSLVFQDKNAYRDGIMKQYADVDLAVDHLTVAAAAKQYLCR